MPAVWSGKRVIFLASNVATAHGRRRGASEKIRGGEFARASSLGAQLIGIPRRITTVRPA